MEAGPAGQEYRVDPWRRPGSRCKTRPSRNGMKLTEVPRGLTARVRHINDERARFQALRFGIGEGSYVQVREKIPHGPVIVGRHQQEIAIGYRLAEAIEVDAAPELPASLPAPIPGPARGEGGFTPAPAGTAAAEPEPEGPARGFGIAAFMGRRRHRRGLFAR